MPGAWLLSEYVFTGKKSGCSGARAARQLNDRAWQVAVSYVLTGENASYGAYGPGKRSTG
jgi:hypothetical protein